MISAFLILTGIVFLGASMIFSPVVGAAWWLRKGYLKTAFQADTKKLPPRTRERYVEVLMQEAVTAHHVGDHERAVLMTRRVLEMMPNEVHASRLCLSSLFAMAQYTDALECLHRHLEKHPHDKAARLVPAAIYCEQGLLEQAKAALDELNPREFAREDRALWYNNYAYALAGLQLDLDTAKEYAEVALELALESDRHFALRTLGIVALAQHEFEYAARCFIQALSYETIMRQGDIDFTRFHLAQSFEGLQRDADAREQYQYVAKGKTVYAQEAQEAFERL
jgi:tetratricopeptide (TPR) repeat protein